METGNGPDWGTFELMETGESGGVCIRGVPKAKKYIEVCTLFCLYIIYVYDCYGTVCIFFFHKVAAWSVIINQPVPLHRLI